MCAPAVRISTTKHGMAIVCRTFACTENALMLVSDSTYKLTSNGDAASKNAARLRTCFGDQFDHYEIVIQNGAGLNELSVLIEDLRRKCKNSRGCQFRGEQMTLVMVYSASESLGEVRIRISDIPQVVMLGPGSSKLWECGPGLINGQRNVLLRHCRDARTCL